jgi:tryptophan synthase alpha chain
VSPPVNRINARFAALAREGRAGLVTFVTAGDPDLETSAGILAALPAAGADVIELGMPFTDPMADGPAIQEGNIRALAAGTTLRKILAMVSAFRRTDDVTPVVLMGYLNPIHAYGVPAFVADAKAAGVDGLIVVDVPPEEDDEIGGPARAGGIHFVRLATPTTDAARMPAVVGAASGFLYYVSVAGITGAASGQTSVIAEAVTRLRGASGLPIAVGFGIKTPAQAADIARIADAVVVGSALVNTIGAAAQARANDIPARVAAQVSDLAKAVRAARNEVAA